MPRLLLAQTNYPVLISPPIPPWSPYPHPRARPSRRAYLRLRSFGFHYNYTITRPALQHAYHGHVDQRMSPKVRSALEGTTGALISIHVRLGDVASGTSSKHMRPRYYVLAARLLLELFGDGAAVRVFTDGKADHPDIAAIVAGLCGAVVKVHEVRWVLSERGV